MIKIISYNLNGVRSALSKGFAEWLSAESPDIICIQETKAQPDQIDAATFKSIGYETYAHSAEKKGYSGVAILTKRTPKNVIVGMGNPKFDAEGRVLHLDFDDFSVISVYIPSGTTGEVRQDVKMEFLAEFQKFINNLKINYPNLIISGDYNICHKAIDINHPERQAKSSGFLPEERSWVDGFIASGLTDTFRMFNSQPNQYSWWSYRAGSRAKNLGWRIDYHFITNSLINKVKSARILTDIIHSDHCPIVVEMDF